MNDDICEIWSTYHTVPKYLPGATIFGQGMLFEMPYIVDWNRIGEYRQEHIGCNDAGKKAQIAIAGFNIVVDGQVMICKDGILCSKAAKWTGAYKINKICTSESISIQ